MSASVTPATSPLLAMHNRYLQAWEEQHTIEVAAIALNEGEPSQRALKFRYEQAMQANAREADALQLAILYQVPTTWPEALALQYHIHSAADPHTERNETENSAVEVALDTLFDFMCDEIDHDESDSIFHRGECIVSDRRCFRTGKVEVGQ